MKSAALELQAHSIGFELVGKESAQAEGTAISDLKYELLADIEKVGRWADVFSQHSDGKDEREMALSTRIQSAKTRLIELALEIIALKERGAAGSLLQERK